ncbi:DUF1707 SHOCT-like domain-containing protein [Labedaea rhizosphaerae]|uniref:Uncharacterized protein DUF1707 n=1 Tax=Labedaea rhizosphaerae TaxID=598644 RepID=A0A4R6S2W8_LABRH|nr:DUF1707 domain-containing protein [Labedaea rhizosphaerae]TDP93989.1 uncharacterized protein DUF1707 [Labedaea rhizosphaerae]
MAGSANIRVGSAERESALHALAEHLTADRLDVAEYEQRCAAVTAARTRADLLAVFDDLPVPHPKWDPEELEPATAPEQSPLIDNSPARLSRPIVLALGAIMIVAAVVVAAVTTTWWALLPALLIIIVMFLTN